MRKVAYGTWRAEGRQKYGEEMANWKFKCPSCGRVQSFADCKVVGMQEGSIGISCIGHWLSDKPCEYMGGRMNPVEVILPDGNRLHVFEWAD